MGVNLGSARGSIEIDTKGVANAERAVDRASKKMTSDMDKLGKGVGGLQDHFRKLDNILGVSFLAGAAIGIGKTTYALGEAAAQAELTERSFEKMAAGVGQSADDLLAGMRTASRGVISDSKLILGANRAIGTGVADTSRELNQILEIARATGQAYGKTTTDAYQRIVEAVSKLEPELLDELGITVRLDQVFRSYAKSLGTTAERLTDAQRKQAFLNEIIKQSADEVKAAGDKGDTAADKFGRFEASTEKLGKSWGDLINSIGVPESLEGISNWMQRATDDAQFLRLAIVDLGQAFGLLPRSWQSSWNPGVETGVGKPNQFNDPVISPERTGPSQFDKDKLAVGMEWAKGVSEVNKRLNEEILDAEESYGQQRADTVKDYIKGVAREERDFNRQRLRDNMEHLDNIADIYRDATRRESKAADALARQLGKAREDTNERLAELDEDYQRNREKAARDHRDNLMEAAGRLDAKAVAEAQRNFKRQEEDAKESHDKQRDEIQKRLQEQIDEANEAHQRQLTEAREADAERVADMKADFVKRQTLEDEDRAIRNADRAQDQADQLAEQDRAHQDRLAQIGDHAQDERDKLDEEANTALAALGVRNKAFDDMMARRQAYWETLWDKFMGHVETSLGGRPGTMPPGFGETDAPAGFGVSGGGGAGAVAIGGNRNVNVGGIHIYPTPNQQPYDIADEVEKTMMRLLQEVGS